MWKELSGTNETSTRRGLTRRVIEEYKVTAENRTKCGTEESEEAIVPTMARTT